ncbi:MAG TPA: peptidyl-prolyl cis-trans isomerase [Solirubrobacteraceae bacterium]
MASLLTRRTDLTVPTDAAAMVNGSPIRKADLERALTALAADRRDPLGTAERRLVLDRLVEEELLVQRASELGLDRRDRDLRTRVVTAMVDAILADGTRPDPTPEQVAAFYGEHAATFAQPARLWVRNLEVRMREGRSDDQAREVALRAAVRLRAGEDFAAVAAALGDPPVAPLPDGPLSPTMLREFLGPAVAHTALQLAPGAVSDPVQSAGAFHVLQAVERDAGTPPPLAEVEDDVRAEMRRRADDDALRAYLDDLRRRATIRVREP